MCVPTGNFGNILAAYYAKEMGIPINRLICASNHNNVLTGSMRYSISFHILPIMTRVWASSQQPALNSFFSLVRMALSTRASPFKFCSSVLTALGVRDHKPGVDILDQLTSRLIPQDRSPHSTTVSLSFTGAKPSRSLST